MGSWVDPCRNIEMDKRRKRPPLMTLLSAVGTYWNEYSTYGVLESSATVVSTI